MKKALLFARSYSGYHPADYAYTVLSTDLAARGIANADKATEPEAFLDLAGYDLLIMYSDWGEITPEQEQALTSWVEAGGNIVGVHGVAATFKQSEAFHKLLGSLFIKHPAKMPFTVLRRDNAHPITKNVSDAFTVIPDELYILEPKADYQVLLAAEYEGQDVPVVYVRSQGRGRIVYIGLGHGQDNLDTAYLRDLVASACLWA